MVLTKAELVNSLLEMSNNLPRQEAVKLVELFFDEITDCLVKGEEVKLTGFGSFAVRHKKERPGRNPKTGEIVAIKARRVVTFHASQKLKERIEVEKD